MKQCVLTLIALAFTASSVLAAGGIAYVDLQKALNTSNAGVAAKQEISEQVKKYEVIVKEKQDALLTLKDEIEKQSVLLSEDAKSQKMREYQQQGKDLERFTKDIQEELQQKDADFTNRILEQLSEVIREIGEAEDYDLVLERTGILYTSGRIDITQKVIDAYNAKQQ
ncbi:MAG: OmpH family outer membrane protein [Desulfuromonadales bacterium]|jgi:outer membrane protein|nr:OmpH family outer membrane protein [Desulfuromonadales bacterium]